MFGDAETMEYGLYFEMLRYLFVVYPSIYHYHFHLMRDKKNELKMEVWNNAFDENVKIILDKLNLINTEENIEKLRKNELNDIDINTERNKLYTMMKTQDTGKVRSKDNGIILEGNEARRRNLMSHRQRHRGGWNGRMKTKHIHRGRNDTKYIDALLTIDINICLLLKHITNLIEYGWSYSNYC